jgi:lysophospholipase L1-like esterase
MLSPAGGSRPDLFTDDGLHMNSAGYALWTTHVRAWLDALPVNQAGRF